ncbi:MAG: hypothetical protein AAF550_10085 [Myxococcota bacterium]
MQGRSFKVPVQIVLRSGHTSERYVSEQGWLGARIQQCPKCNGPIRRHGTYRRKTPEGIRIARFYCRPCQMTVSLLPSFLAAGYSEELAVQQQAVATAAACSGFDEAARTLRADIELQGARRWLRRRLARHRLALLIVATLFGVPIASIDLFAMRTTHPDALRQVPTPVGLAHRPLTAWRATPAKQHTMGPDPPTEDA